jgi:hypothetical protein
MKNTLFTLALGLVILPTLAIAQSTPAQTQRYFNGPTVSNVTSMSAVVSLSDAVLAGIPSEDRSQVYFEYSDVHQVCIAIYPTPAECLPKTTPKGQMSVTLSGLKPATTYSVTYKKDNTIRCITTPCPSNEFKGVSVEFMTPVADPVEPPTPGVLTHTLYRGSYGSEVLTLQTILIQKGFLSGTPTGYFGRATLRAVKAFQTSVGIQSWGIVGARTRAALLGTSSSTAETFEGTIQAVSTACFADGICSVTVDGKVVVTTIGWSQQIVGSIRGVASIGDIEQKIGHHAHVYAAKTADGYTLYGSTAYYVEVQ